MLNIDPLELIVSRRRDLLAEADRERLVSLLPRHNTGVRHELAVACYRLANWLDDPARYVQPIELGPEHWAAPRPAA
jgi:hypothetical protein